MEGEIMKDFIKVYLAVWIIPIMLLLVAIFDLPYGYYTFLRLIITASSVFIIWLTWKYQRKHKEIWAIIYVTLILLYNPIAPVRLSKEIWIIINIITVVFYMANVIYLWRSKRKRDQLF